MLGRIVAGDGIFTVLGYPDGARAVLGDVRRVLGPDGQLVVRAFVPPAEDESAGAIVDDLRAGRIGTLSAFKVRLTMALRSRATRSARLGDAWGTGRALVPEPAALFEDLGWEVDSLSTLDAYRDSSVHYAYRTSASWSRSRAITSSSRPSTCPRTSSASAARRSCFARGDYARRSASSPFASRPMSARTASLKLAGRVGVRFTSRSTARPSCITKSNLP
jgi:hypothetical protein